MVKPVFLLGPTLFLSFTVFSGGAVQAQDGTFVQTTDESGDILEATTGITHEMDAIQMETIVIKASVLPADSSSKLAERELQLRAAGTLGKTLERELGVSNLSYGPGVGQPIIRGMSGPRVRVMQNEIGVHDLSAISPDHGVAAEAMLADRITVYRGPAILRYGGNAIGGAVDIKHQRIPDKIPQNGFAGRMEFRFDHNPSEKAGMIALDMGKNMLAIHLDYFHRAANNTHIPGLALDEEAIRQQFQVEPAMNSRGVIQNSDTRSQGGSAGISLVGDAGYIGGSYHEMMREYGIPPGVPGHSHGDNTEQEAVRVNLAQRRFELEGFWLAPWSILPTVQAKLGYIDYEQDDVDRGVRYTHKKNKVWESRLELNHQQGAWLDGFIGLQWQDRNFSATGVETFVPPSEIDSLGVFLTETLMLHDRISLEFGARLDYQTVAPKISEVKIAGIPDPLPLPERIRHNPYSLAVSLNYEIFPRTALYLSWQQAQRAPDVQELLSSGPHLATRSFELGRTDLKTEQSNHHELGLRFTHELASLHVNGYYNRVKNFIYLQNQGFFFNLGTTPPRFQLACANLSNCLPVFAYQGDNATFWGYEAELSFYPKLSAFKPHLTLFSDYVRGRFNDSDLGDVPRLPPLRFGAEIGIKLAQWQGALRYTHALEQNRPGLFETATPGYDRLDLDVTYDWKLSGRRKILLFSKASNMTDSVIRNSASFLRNFAPEPGFSFEVGFRTDF